jgi:DNA (cytosine-5)-methyltransferase 1
MKRTLSGEGVRSLGGEPSANERPDSPRHSDPGDVVHDPVALTFHGDGRPHERTLTRPRLLDLFCGAGGAAMGYHRAGFDVVGVDNRPQPHYPFEFVQDDALALMSTYPWWDVPPFDAIHASPPCQRWTRAQRQRKNSTTHLDLITPVRPLLEATGLPYVIENVEFCDVLREPIVLCGSMFDMDVQRHRLFEANWPLEPPWQPCRHKIWGKGRYPNPPYHDTPRGMRAMVVNPMASGVTHALFSEALGIDWIPPSGERPTQELREAIPPAYTELIGHQLLQHLRVAA